MKKVIFFPGYRLMSLFRRTSERFFQKFLIFVSSSVTGNKSKIGASRDLIEQHIKVIVAGFIYENYSYVGREVSEKNWDVACDFVAQKFPIDAMLVRHLIYNTYCFFLMENTRHARAASGTYDTSFVSMLIILVGKEDILRYFEEALSKKSYPGWMDFWVRKVCTREMGNFLSRDEYKRKERVPFEL